MKAFIINHDLVFITPGMTSRGTLYSKPSWFIILEKDDIRGIGECSVIPGLNPESGPDYPKKIDEVIDRIHQNDIPALTELDDYPSIRFGLETALLDMSSKNPGIIYPTAFTEGKAGIPINGLVWMGSKAEMKERIKEKLDTGFRVLKLKVGSLLFDEELDLLKEIRKEYSPGVLELRLDANGAFSPGEAMSKLHQLSEYHIHSVEQPIKAGQWIEMAAICHSSPIPIALDEELIGITDPKTMEKMLETIHPQYIILKPSLTGGLSKSMEWIGFAQKHGIGWWATSALESNIGLNAIAQWTYTLKPDMVQGLGTGKVFSNNIPSPLTIIDASLHYSVNTPWDFAGIFT